ncbi:WD40 repeat domain-containing protein [Rhizobium laguerreae]|uniref:WD40 repeat domain-containing protein n=1 Tax=Rhizobium laguerreae TaxID=1076926 RepID=UPI001C920922|nr:WD40 repeat domain-containing protein [Rhizobium laguerreae]MBY3328523.1 WD40 repeat domain-containing protein [Rhizobium laguerreae]
MARVNTHLLMYVVGIFLNLCLASNAGAFRLEIQSPPHSSVSASFHPSRPNIFANLEKSGEITLWELGADRRAIKTLSILGAASAVELLDSPSDPRGTLVVSGTHYGEVKIYSSSGKMICTSSNSDASDIVYLAHSASQHVIIGASISGEVGMWTDGCARLLADTSQSKSHPTGLQLSAKEDIALISSYDGTLLGIDLRSKTALGKVKFTSPGTRFQGGLRGLAISPNGDRVVIAKENHLSVFEESSFRDAFRKRQFGAPREVIQADGVVGNTLAFLGDGASVLFGDYSTLSVSSQGLKHVVWPKLLKSIVVAADGKTVLGSPDNAPPMLWQFGFSQVGAPVRIATSKISAFALSSSNEIIAAAEDGTLRTVLSDGRVSLSGLDLDGATYSVDVTRDGKQLVSGGQGAVVAVTDRVSKQQDLKGYFPPGADARDLFNLQYGHFKFLRDQERFVAATSWSDLQIWNKGADAPLHVIAVEPPRGTTMDIAVCSNDDTLIVARENGLDETQKARVLVLKIDGSTKFSIESPFGNELLAGVACSADGKLFLSYSRSSIRVFSVEDGRPFGAALPIHGSHSIEGARFLSGQPSVVAVLDDGSVSTFSPGQDGVQFEDHVASRYSLGNDVVKMELSPDRTFLVSGSRDGFVNIWQLGLNLVSDFSAGKVDTGVDRWFARGLPPTVCGAVEERVVCWDTKGGAIPMPQYPELGGIVSTDIDPSNSRVATIYSKGRIVVSKLGDLSPLGAVDVSPEETGWIRWFDEGRRFLVVSETAKVFELDADERTIRPRPEFDVGERLTGVFPLPDGGIAVLNGTKVSLRNAEQIVSDVFEIPSSCSRQFRFQPAAFSRDVTSAAFSCDQSFLIMRKDAGAWRVVSNSSVWKPAASIAFDSAGKTIVSGDNSGAVIEWESLTGKQIRRIDVGQSVSHVAVTNSVIVVGSNAGEVYFFSSDSGEPIGRTAFSVDGSVTIASGGSYAKVGNAWPVIGFDEAGRRIGEEETIQRWSSEIVGQTLYTRDSILTQLWIKTRSVAAEAWTTFSNLPLYQQIVAALATIYGAFFLIVLCMWVAVPAALCSWALRGKKLREFIEPLGEA